MNARWGACLLSAALSGCGFVDAPGTPLIQAHRAGAGYWPENSRSAVRASIARRDAGIEFDVALTKDRVPVLSHAPHLDEKLCRTVDGRPLPGRVVIAELTLAELWAGYRCGGLPDEDTPDAELLADTHMTFDEVLAALPAVPAMRVQVDLKYEPGETTSPAEIARTVIEHWRRAAPPNPWWVGGDRAELIRAVKAYDPTVEAHIGWPRFPEGGSDTQVALENEAMTMLGLTDLVKVVRDAQADGISIAYQVIDRRTLETLRDEHIKVDVWTLNSKELIETYCRWPIDVILTDYPELATCR